MRCGHGRTTGLGHALDYEASIYCPCPMLCGRELYDSVAWFSSMYWALSWRRDADVHSCDRADIPTLN